MYIRIECVNVVDERHSMEEEESKSAEGQGCMSGESRRMAEERCSMEHGLCLRLR